MVLLIQKNKTVGDIQFEFNQLYPFLKIDFYRSLTEQSRNEARQKLIKTAPLLYNGGNREGELNIYDSMTVGQLEKAFFDNFNMYVQVARKSGPVWIETTITDSWTLERQNEHGRELAVANIKNNLETESTVG